MNQLSQPTGPIRLFNLDSDEFRVMYTEELPPELIALIVIAQPFRRASRMGLLVGMESELARLIRDMNLGVASSGYATRFRFIFVEDRNSVPHWAYRTDEHDAWMLEGGLVQVGFIDPRLLGDNPLPTDGVFKASQIQDAAVCRMASVEVTDLAACPPCKGCSKEFVTAVGDLYRDRIAIMNRKLVELRNAVAVAVRVRLQGKDGTAAYSAFLAKGGTYFLQYPSLCECVPAPIVAPDHRPRLLTFGTSDCRCPLDGRALSSQPTA